ncbi:uncharacterized protein LMH87_008006 [Akanthomyces muscarius]|uniref:Cytochrome P450 n=1 Tax=Akanthomyces muscarius TaxID=2231603 RepID=A0A9W8QLU2_AKAMU|nr:uncharacterized protein LMH87_008006 [Akanthomyces muscarius]KAJ4160076.1 hypothetical protein LMH87_008006 [Akanthomyces muscarius]
MGLSIITAYTGSSMEFVGISLFAAILCLYATVVVTYRVTFHPLSQFPGPMLARASYGYEFWFDVVHKGQFTRKVAELHKVYGSIVRVNPDELHCNDPAFIDILYRQGKEKRDKSSHYLAAFPRGVKLATVGTANHDEHRQRRVPVAKYLSRSRISKHESVVHEKAQLLCAKLLAWDKNEPFQLTAAYSCFTTDTLTKYAFGHSLENLKGPGWKPTFKGTVDKMTGLFYLSRHLPFLACLAEYLPLNVCRYISTEIYALLELIRIVIPQLVQDSLDIRSFSERKDVGKTYWRGSRASSGRDSQLRAELRSVVRDETALPPWSTLEQLPYLNAVIQEALRLMHGVASRISLVAPDGDLVYVAPDNSSHVIPCGSAIGVSTYMIHTDPKLYPDPTSFVPQRWLNANGFRNRELDKYMLSFSKGPRQCVGMHLAYCELHIAMAALALRALPHMRLYNTTVADVAYDHDQLISMPKTGSIGVQIMIH